MRLLAVWTRETRLLVIRCSLLKLTLLYRPRQIDNCLTRLGDTALVDSVVTLPARVRWCALSLLTPSPVQDSSIVPVLAKAPSSPLTLLLMWVSLTPSVANPGPIALCPVASARNLDSPPITLLHRNSLNLCAWSAL